MNENDDLFLKKLMEAFKLESDEHLKALSDGLLALENGLPPEQTQAKVELIFREVHSLKGAARSVSLYMVQEICQAFENVLAAWRAKQLQIAKGSFNTFHAALDLIALAIAGQAGKTQAEQMIKSLDAIIKNESPQPVQAVKEESQAQEGPPPIASKQEEAPELAKAPPKKMESIPANKKEANKDKTIRISMSKLDQLFHEAEEVLMVKMSAQQNIIELKHLLNELGNAQKNFKQTVSQSTVVLTRQAEQPNARDVSSDKFLNSLLQHQHELKGIHDKLSRKLKAAEQTSHFINSTIDTLLEDAKQVLMQPIGTIFEALPRMVRDISQQLGKETRIEFEGEGIEVDRRVLEEIKDPIIHLIRNAIDHGIENPQDRLRHNKPSAGVIKIAAVESGGNNMTLSIIDDGQGIDLLKIKEKAVAQKILSQEEAESLTDQQAYVLAFHSGLSTSPIISDLSGRGLGLGIVSEKVDKLDGRIDVESIPGKGTTFKLSLPLALSTFRGVHIQISGTDFIMPIHNIKRAIRIMTKDIKTVENRQSIVVEGQPISFVHLSSTLNLPKKDAKPEEKDSQLALIVTATDKTIAFGVDDIFHEHEVLVKSLGKQCLKVKNILAATIMEEGKVVLILNPADIIRSAIKDEQSSGASEKAVEGETQKKIVLLAEDSLTTRLLMKNVLETAGYEVITAVDGIEAYEQLLTQTVDLLVTDIEMPRMDGFTLTGKVRGLEKLHNLPIIICTSRASREDRERGIELGANAYIDKSSFTQQGLLNFAKKLL